MRIANVLSLGAYSAVFFLPLSVWANQNPDTQELISELREEISILQDQLEENNLASANEMKISGYADIEYHDNSQANANPGFRLHHMSLFFEKNVTDQWKFFSEIEYEDAPFVEFSRDATDSPCKGCYGKIFLESANFTYSPYAQMNLRGGRFFTPAGIWSVDHYPSFTPTQLRPEHIREIFPQVVDGLSLFGTVSLSGAFINYDAYYGNGEGNSGKKDTNSEKAVGTKISFLFPQFKYLEFGLSSYEDTILVDATNSIRKKAAGAHFKFKTGGFTFQGEYAKGQYLPTAAAEYYRTGYYMQTIYELHKLSLGYRYDFYQEDSNTKDDIIFNSVFVNYQVNPSIVFKLERHSVSDEVANENYEHIIGSVVLYLGN
ncbi:MAG: hypothetical protein OEZ68_01400 [Gammaproteobacteria bacterium]|nr:hypothetical protein [Gammaproteobacteria bacterium]MDH5799435.1 hypothetical protein [Gammaproteobacteria bacterium]